LRLAAVNQAVTAAAYQRTTTISANLIDAPQTGRAMNG